LAIHPEMYQQMEFTTSKSKLSAEYAIVGNDPAATEPAGGFLVKRTDFLGVDEEARIHPNRTYYYKKKNDIDEIIDTCTKKLQVR
jgi:hypothetical protein